MPQYKLAATAEARRLDDEAEVSSALGQEYSLRSTDYVLAVVLFAASLFWACAPPTVVISHARTITTPTLDMFMKLLRKLRAVRRTVHLLDRLDLRLQILRIGNGPEIPIVAPVYRDLGCNPICGG